MMMPKLKGVHAVAAAACAIAVLGCAYGLPQMAASPATPVASAGPELARPADIDTWPTVGTTMRMDRTDHSVPWQMRQVQIEPSAYERLVRTLAYPDGTAFAATFYPVELDTSHTPPLYHATGEIGFAMEIIDRGHPDGRRFYNFAPGAATAAALPAGNACAVCHNERGSFDGTFAHLYPTIARFANGGGAP